MESTEQGLVSGLPEQKSFFLLFFFWFGTWRKEIHARSKSQRVRACSNEHVLVLEPTLRSLQWVFLLPTRATKLDFIGVVVVSWKHVDRPRDPRSDTKRERKREMESRATHVSDEWKTAKQIDIHIWSDRLFFLEGRRRASWMESRRSARANCDIFSKFYRIIRRVWAGI